MPVDLTVEVVICSIKYCGSWVTSTGLRFTVEMSQWVKGRSSWPPWPRLFTLQSTVHLTSATTNVLKRCWRRICFD